MQQNLIRENVTKSMLLFADTLIGGGQFPGTNAIAASVSFFFRMVFTVDWAPPNKKTSWDLKRFHRKAHVILPALYL